MNRHPRAVIAWASLATLAGLLSACTGSDLPEPSRSPSASPTVATSAPGASVTASPEVSPTPSPSATDPGVATDGPVAPASPEPGGTRLQVEVSISRWGVVDGMFSAGAGVDGVVEDGGRCTMVLERGDRVVTATGGSVRSATSSACGDGLSVPVSDLSAGTWTLTIEFSSDAAIGESGPQEVEIP